MKIIAFTVQPNGDIYALSEFGTLWVRKANEPELWFKIEGPPA